MSSAPERRDILSTPIGLLERPFELLEELKRYMVGVYLLGFFSHGNLFDFTVCIIHGFGVRGLLSH